MRAGLIKGKKRKASREVCDGGKLTLFSSNDYWLLESEELELIPRVKVSVKGVKRLT